MLTINVPELITCDAVITGNLSCPVGTPVEGAEVFFSDFPEDVVFYDPNPAISDANGDFSTTVTVLPGTPLTAIDVTATAEALGIFFETHAGTQVECPEEVCPCKFRIGIQRNRAPAVVKITDNGSSSKLKGNINVSAVQCFTASPMCNPEVDNFNVTFRSRGTTINFIQGRRIEIDCITDKFAMVRGTALATGNLFTGLFEVKIEVTIGPGNIGTWTIMANDNMGHTFSTTFTARMSPITSIGECGVQF
ncbi:hypothetical protein GLW00_16705 [Halobacillus litoralis]|uniref:Uncharacterized protein n=1 Tax=Halobacillus litoralis TaxID=45668 RepID=A0A845FFA4_9BACI|nr:hypothetical protein [Halobacillus litoralis]MYL72489.1 hypothetical protein [Halobacillus litoralis]